MVRVRARAKGLGNMPMPHKDRMSTKVECVSLRTLQRDGQNIRFPGKMILARRTFCFVKVKGLFECQVLIFQFKG